MQLDFYPQQEDWTVLVDVQKKNANYTDLVSDEVAVIDHHSYNGPQGYRYEDVRDDVGACASIIASYFHESGTEIPRLVATSLFYGILMDTDGLTRGVSQLDINIFYLYSLQNPSVLGPDSSTCKANSELTLMPA